MIKRLTSEQIELIRALVRGRRRLRERTASWRDAACWEFEHGSPEFGRGLDQCADEVDALTRVPQPGENGPFPISNPSMTWDEAIEADKKKTRVHQPEEYEEHPVDCACDQCTCTGCGNHKHVGPCRTEKRTEED